MVGQGSPLNRRVVSRAVGTGARWCELGNRRFYARSGWEGNYGCYLEWLRLQRGIKDWKHEPETFWFEGIRRGCVSYLPDFEVVENSGERILHEVKGWMDPKSLTKIRRMKKYYPHIRLHVVERAEYHAINRKIGRLVPGWV